MVSLIANLISSALRFGRRGYGISFIIPFRNNYDADERIRNLTWLKRYWRTHFPGAEIVIGDDPDVSKPFSKSVAINRAVAKSHGDVLVIVDADGYLAAESVLHCAQEIRHARKRGFRLWFVPYRKFYRLNNEATLPLLESDPADPYVFPSGFEGAIVKGADPTAAHYHGALIQIMPREAFDLVGGWDERFRGWGGEDHAAMRSIDTLYGLHKTLPGYVLHLWHPMIGRNGKADMVSSRERLWAGQTHPNTNSQLARRYYDAIGKPKLMRSLADGWKKDLKNLSNNPVPYQQLSF